MANALKFYGNPDTTETERFVRTIDKFFDCLNVRSPNEYIRKRKENLKPYTDVEDERLSVSCRLYATTSCMHVHYCTHQVLLDSTFTHNSIQYRTVIIIIVHSQELFQYSVA